MTVFRFHQLPRYANRSFKEIPKKKLIKVYEAMERNLQTADLTINFHANDWFAGKNDSETYSQMYQRAVRNGRMKLESTDLNDAQQRARVDNQVTFPSNWQGAQTPRQRGLSPGPQGPARLMGQMDTGALVDSPTKRFAFNASNEQFNPNTKQFFTRRITSDR